MLERRQEVRIVIYNIIGDFLYKITNGMGHRFLKPQRGKPSVANPGSIQI